MNEWLTGAALLVTALGVAIPAIGGFIIAWRVNEKVVVLHELTNSNSEKLNAVTAGKAFAEGKEAGITEERASPMVPATPTV